MPRLASSVQPSSIANLFARSLLVAFPAMGVAAVASCGSDVKSSSAGGGGTGGETTTDTTTTTTTPSSGGTGGMMTGGGGTGGKPGCQTTADCMPPLVCE